MSTARAVTLDEIRMAQDHLRGIALRTPLVPCPVAPGLRLKLEALQEIGAFKVRPVGNAILSRAPGELASGIYTSSSGNAALALAWMARRLGLRATAVVPDNAPPGKLAPLQRLGTTIETLSFDDWWSAILNAEAPGQAGLYIDAVRDPAAIAGNATVGAEIIADWPEVDAILVPMGGGGLSFGIACAAKALKPGVKVIVCELETAAPLTAARRAGGPVTIAYDPGFITGAGASTVLPEMWPLLRDAVDDTITVSLDEVAAAIRVMAKDNHVVAEGAGALAVAAALSGKLPYANVAAVVSGGNIDPALLSQILR